MTPNSILSQIHCACKKTSCSSGKCTCRIQNLKCFELCVCQNCTDCIRVGNDDDEEDDVEALLRPGQFDLEEVQEEKYELLE